MPAERDIVPLCRASSRVQRRERALGALATRQHGVVARRQLAALGFSAKAIECRIAAGRLLRLQPAVYAVGHKASTRESRWMAAVLSAGEGAILSHHDAAVAHGVASGGGARIDVSVPRHQGRSSAAVRLHRRAWLHEDEVIGRSGIPCASLSLALLDFSAVVRRRTAERAFDQAEVLRIFDLRAMQDVLRRRSGERGAGVVRAILAEHAIGETVTKRELEERFLNLCLSSGLPQPRVNCYLMAARQAWEVDFHWPAARLVVETDGLAFHRTITQIERDRRRDLDLTAAGWRVLRITWRQVTREPDVVVTTLRPLVSG